MALKVIVTETTDDALLTLRGALDAGSARVLRLKAQSLLATGHTRQVVDLAEAEVDHDGVQVLRYVRRITRIAGGATVFRGCDLDLGAQLIDLEGPVVRVA